MSPAERIVLTASILCLLAGAYLRVVAANDYLWLDELHTGWTVSGDLSEVYWRSADGNQSPVYFYLCFAAVKLLGYSANALRSVSLIGAMLLLIGLPLVVYRTTRCAAAVFLVSLFLMLDYECVFYASEARPYGMLQWLGGLQAVCFWCWSSRLFENEGARSLLGFRWLASWPVVSLLSAAVVSTHVTGAWLLLAETIFVVLICSVKRKWPGIEIWKCVALFLVLAAPALLAVATAWQRRGNWSSVSNIDLVLTQFAWASGVMVILPAVVLAADRWGCLNKKGDCEVSWKLLVFIGLWALVPTSSIALMDYMQVAPLGLARYALVGSVAFPLYGALAMKRMNSKVIRWATLSIMASFILWNSSQWLRPTLPPMSDLRNENWADAVATIAKDDPGYPVLLAGNVLEDVDARRNRSPRFQAYLKFPVLGADPSLENPILPLNTQGELFSDDEADAVDAAGTGWLIVRDLPENAALILELIQQNPRSEKFQFDLAQFASPVPNYVLLFRITRK
jgi:hypothetical protein